MLPLPSIAAAALQTARTEPGLLRAQLLTLPSALAASTVPFAVPGVVREVGAGGQLRISTAWGDLQLRVAGEIAVGRDITVVIRPGARPEAMLLPARPLSGSAPAPIALPEGSPSLPAVMATPITAAGIEKPAGAVVPASPGPAATGGAQAPALTQAAMLATLAATEGMGLPSAAITYPGSPALPVASELLMVLRDMQRTLAASDPSLASAVSRRLPAADRAGGIAMAMLLAALKRGAVRSLLGKPVEETLSSAGRADLIEALETGLSRSERQPDAEADRIWEWRTLPLIDRGAVLPMAVGIARDEHRDQQETESSEEQPAACRFAVELSLSAIGRTRVDATYRPARLDLVIQTDIELPGAVYERIAAALRPVFEEFGLTGNCRFVTPDAQAPAAIRI
jgi:hypothetical protein